MSDEFNRKMDKQIHIILEKRCNELQRKIDSLEKEWKDHLQCMHGFEGRSK